MPHLATTFGCAGPQLTPRERDFLAAAQPWGFILFARNVENPGQLARLTADLRDAVGRHAPILIDQEGGRVQRLTPPYWRQFLPPLDQMAATEAATVRGAHGHDARISISIGPEGKTIVPAPPSARSLRAMYLRARLIAHDLHAVGIDVNCAPLADLARAETHPFLRNRLYGESAAQVVPAARATARGLMAGGVLPVLKHIPGHGRATLDSHLALPRVSVDAATLRAEDFAAFQPLTDLPMAMTAHLVYEAFDPDRPATTSPAMIRLIRDEIGFDGLLMTDDISMEALSGSVTERAGAALAAGCDLVLHCNGDMAEMEALAGALPPLTDAATARAEAALALRAAPDPVDIAALDAELERLIKG